MIGALGEEVVERRGARDSGVKVVELVPGRETGEDTLRGCISRSARSAAFLLLEEGRGGDDSSGFPNARPTAATPTVLDATSCLKRNQRISITF